MEHDRPHKNKKKYSSYKQQEREKEEKPMKRPIILMKAKDSSASDSTGGLPVQPTILLKPRDKENSAASPQTVVSSSKQAKESENTPWYQIASRASSQAAESATAGASKASASSQPQPKPTPMKECVKLLDDDTLTMKDSLLEHLTDSSDFLVVGCLGLQGVGKSTIMSHLAVPPSNEYPERDSNLVFKKQSKNQVDSASHCTEGIDAFVTKERVIFLDSQPLLSLSVLSKYYNNEGSNFVARSCNRDDPDFPCIENDAELLSLQYAAFLLTVCHVVLIVQDYFMDPDLMRFIQTAEMLKPSSGIHSDEETLIEYYPHCVFVHNKSKPINFSRGKLKTIQELYRQIFSQSHLTIQSGIGISNGSVTPSLTPELCEVDPLNVFLLPLFNKTKENIPNLFDYASLVDSLRCQVFGLPPPVLTHTILSEKNWWHYAAKIWEDIKKNKLFPEYGRLLPNASSAKFDA